MARTKKYLTTPKTSRGFYRPLSRSARALGSPALPEADGPLTVAEVREDLKRLEDQIAQAEALKQALTYQIAVQQHAEAPTARELDIAPKPLSASQVETSARHAEVSDRYALLEKELAHAIRKDDHFADELKAMKGQFESEKKELLETIKKLKSEVSGQKELVPNRLATISQELRVVVQAMDQLVQSDALNAQADPPSTPPPSPSDPNSAPPPVSAPSPSPTATPLPTPSSVTPEPPPTLPTATPTVEPAVHTKSRFHLPKPVLILATTVLIVGAIGGGIWYFLARDTQVDTALLSEYLPEQAGTNPASSPQAQEEEKKIEPTTPAATSPPSSPASTTNATPPKTLGASDSQYSESQANVPLDQTTWETLKHPLGFSLDFPSNVVNVIRTETSLTFIRKTGYIFKIQFIETALSVDEYWKLVKASSLNYKVVESELLGIEALYLQLQDFTDYPGDRYFVKQGEFVYDIWFATTSKNLSSEDEQRVERMLKSFKFIEPSV